MLFPSDCKLKASISFITEPVVEGNLTIDSNLSAISLILFFSFTFCALKQYQERMPKQRNPLTPDSVPKELEQLTA